MELFREIHIPLTECIPSQKVRMALGEIYSTDRVWAISEGRREALKYGVVSFYGLGNFIR